MRTLMSNIFKVYILSVLVILIFISGCSDDPSSPQKEEEEKPETTATIGVEGGTVGTDDISITIPAGAFTSKQEIAIYEELDDGAFGENTATSTFKITGLPDDYTKPIKIKMKYSGELSGSSFLALGIMRTNTETEDSSVVYGLFSAIDSSGYITSEISAESNENQMNLFKEQKTTENKKVWAKFITSYATTQTPHFTIRHPLSAISYLPKVQEIFEDAYTFIFDVLKMPNINNEKFIHIRTKNYTVGISPAHVLMNDPLTSELGYWIGMDGFNNSGYNKIQIAAAQHLLFSARLVMKKSEVGWVEGAIKHWIEDFITKDPNYTYVSYYGTHAMEPFYGLNYKDPTENYWWDHESGMSAVIEYLTQLPSFGRAGIGKIFENYLDPHFDPLNGLFSLIEPPESEWWPDFIKKYVNGDIYNIPVSFFIDNATDEFTILSPNDTSEVFTASDPNGGPYLDLSAKIFNITLNSENFDTTNSLQFSMDSYGEIVDKSVIIFGVKNNKAEYIGTGYEAGFEILNIKSRYNSGMKQFLAIVVNGSVTQDNFLGETDIDLTVTVKRQEQLDYNKCIVMLGFDGDLETVYTNGIPNSYSKTSGLDSEYASGSLEGNIFTGTYDENGKSGTIIIELNQEKNMITNMSWSGFAGFSNGNAELGFSCSNIPIHSIFNEKYYIQGTTTCNALTSAYYTYVGNGGTTTLTDYRCDEFSYIDILFLKE